MTAIAWDQVGDRRYETGLDRGVLYPFDGPAVPWNGLTQLEETKDREVKSYYVDGIKYLDRYVPGTYAAKLSAFTYPDELDEIMGNQEWVPGVFVHDQNPKMFHLSYRTGIGNDTEGLDHGYRIHLVYNLTGVPGNSSSQTLDKTPAPAAFSWDLTGVPPTMFGIRPTSHISIDSRRVDPDVLETIENTIYGTALADAELPSVVDLLTMLDPS